MPGRTLTLDDLRGRTAEDLVREVAGRAEVVTVELESGRSIRLEPQPPLKPLLTLDGRVPEGWKDAVYSE